MLSRNHPSIALRAAAGTLVAALLVIAFAPIRLSAFDTSETHGSQKVDGTPTRVAYLIHKAGEKGTRGSIHIPYDMSAARDLGRMTRDVVYFRIQNRRWICYDDDTIAEVRRALEPVDRFEASREAPIEAQRAELDAKVERLEEQQNALEPRKDALEDRLRALEERWQEWKDSGRSTRALEAEKDRLELERDALQRRYEELGRQRDALEESQRRIDSREKVLYAERERMDRMATHAIERIARRAVAAGVAHTYPGGGSRNGGSDEEGASTRVFSPPSAPIW